MLTASIKVPVGSEAIKLSNYNALKVFAPRASGSAGGVTGCLRYMWTRSGAGRWRAGAVENHPVMYSTRALVYYMYIPMYNIAQYARCREILGGS